MNTDGANCPVCGWQTIPIVYGLPLKSDLERDDIVLGGCLVEEGNPDLSCTNCDWTGQDWFRMAPLPPAVWVVQDTKDHLAPIGLVAGRYDDVIEVFQLGQWLNVTFTKQYEEWLDAAGEDAVALTIPFGQLSPGIIADFRIGEERFPIAALYAMGFERLIKPPKLKFDGRMEIFE